MSLFEEVSRFLLSFEESLAFEAAFLKSVRGQFSHPHANNFDFPGLQTGTQQSGTIDGLRVTLTNRGLGFFIHSGFGVHYATFAPLKAIFNLIILQRGAKRLTLTPKDE